MWSYVQRWSLVGHGWLPWSFSGRPLVPHQRFRNPFSVEALTASGPSPQITQHLPNKSMRCGWNSYKWTSLLKISITKKRWPLPVKAGKLEQTVRLIICVMKHFGFMFSQYFMWNLLKIIRSIFSAARFPPWESDMKRRQPCQVHSSLIPCMLRREQSRSCRPSCLWKHWLFLRRHSGILSFRLSTRQWSFCIPKEPWAPRTWLPVSHACPTAPVPHQRSGALCFLKRELSLPPLSSFDDSLGADSLTLRVLRMVVVGSWGSV